MSWSRIQNFIAREVERICKRNAPHIRFGIVDSFNPAGPAVRIKFPDDLDADGNPTLSPWMPVIEPAAGPGSGDLSPPTIGAQAVVFHIGWGAERWTFMMGTVRSSQDAVPAAPNPPTDGSPPPPPGAPAGDRWIVHPAGQGIYLRADGTALIGTGNGHFLRLATEDFVLNKFNMHSHPYQPGDGTMTQTGAPNLTVPASGDTTDLTASIKGN
jgi:hypothetical protein